MRGIGVEIRKELKLIPAKVVVVEHAAHTYACRNCEQNGIEVPFAKAESPKLLISVSIFSGVHSDTKIRMSRAEKPKQNLMSGYTAQAVAPSIRWPFMAIRKLEAMSIHRYF